MVNFASASQVAKTKKPAPATTGAGQNERDATCYSTDLGTMASNFVTRLIRAALPLRPRR